MLETSSYHLGREVAEIVAPYHGQDKVFGGQRLDNGVFKNPSFQHCTFANISFKETRIQEGVFLNCVFIGCYFRRAEFINTQFIGCRFFDCNFSHVAIRSCNFRHSVFQGGQLSYSELVHSLPSEPNLREEITRNLAVESANLGLSSEARKYRMAEIRAHEEHLLAAALGKSQWYKEHFDFLGRLEALGQWILSRLNGLFWGYGERSWVLIRNLLFTSFLLFPSLFYLYRSELKNSSDREPSLSEIVHFSLENVIPAGVVSNVIAADNTVRFLAGLESLLGVVAIALFASYIFRWSLHR